MNNQLYNKSFKLFILFILILLQSGYLAAQQDKTISGKITDSKTREPIIGAVVTVKGTTIGVATNEKGQFSLKIKKLPSVLVVSNIGYESQRVIANTTEQINLSLNEVVSRLDEVVITGYSTQERKSISG